MPSRARPAALRRTRITEPFSIGMYPMEAAASMAAIVGMLPTDRIAYVDPGMGGVQLEFVGPAGAAGLREWLGADFDTLLQPPPPW